MISSVRSSRTACIAAVNGSGCAIWPCTSMPSARSVDRAARRRRSASGCSERVGSLCGATIRKLASLSRALARMRSSSGSPSTVSFATTSTFARARAASALTTCSTGLPARSLANLLEEVLPQPSRLRLGMGRDDDLVDVLRGEGVLDGAERIVVDHVAVGGNPGLAECRECPVEAPTGCRTSRVAIDDVPGSRLGHRSDHSDSNRSRFGTTLHRGDELGADECLVRHDEDGRTQPSCVHLLGLARLLLRRS